MQGVKASKKATKKAKKQVEELTRLKELGVLSELVTDCEGHLADAVGDKNDLIRCSRIDEIEQVLRRKGPW